jgi:hypothetical protein
LGDKFPKHIAHSLQLHSLRLELPLDCFDCTLLGEGHDAQAHRTGLGLIGSFFYSRSSLIHRFIAPEMVGVRACEAILPAARRLADLRSDLYHNATADR